ncbi:MAG TPA: rod shape-determining protein MreD [Vicinamibacterales bacterium]|jgi:rod shape-determining protein MreD|nr:rod shape-determining protein MreD [Vicinamibacterales bacterium]
MKTPIVIAALAVALLLQSTIAGMSFTAASRVNLVLVAVIYVGLAYGAVTGMLAGCAAGLVQDAIAGGIVGIGGLSKTIVGFFVGVLGAQFIVSTPVPRFLMFFGASLVHELCFQALYALVEAHSIRLQISGALIQALVNGAVGITIFMLAERGPEMMQRDNWRRSSTVRRRY